MQSDVPRSAVTDSLDPGPLCLESQDSETPYRRSTYTKKSQKNRNENLEGVMFLPDGRVLILNNDMYQEVMKKGIIIDMKDKAESRVVSLILG